MPDQFAAAYSRPLCNKVPSILANKGLEHRTCTPLGLEVLSIGVRISLLQHEFLSLTHD